MKFFLIWVTLFLIISGAKGQEEYHKFYEADEIRSKEVLKGIVKDDKGVIWLATDEGVLKFDGSDTELYYKELPTPFTKSFLKRSNGQLIIAHDAGIKEIVQENDSVYFKNPVIYGFTIDQSFNYPKSIYEDEHGNIWIGEVDALVRINENGLKRFDLGTDFQSISYHHTFAFTEDAFGNLWIAPFKGPLLRYNNRDEKLQEVDIKYPLTEVSDIETVKGDYLFVSGREGLMKIKVDSDKNILQSSFINDLAHISALKALSNDNVYVGTWDNGLHKFDFSNRVVDIKKLDNVPFVDILDFYLDKNNGELWITSSENVGLLKRSLIQSIEAVGKQRVESLDIDNSGKIYYSIERQIFTYDANSNPKVKDLLYLPHTYFDRILYHNEKVWIGDAFGGIYCYEVNTGNTINVMDSTNHSVLFVSEDSAGNKWFTGNPAGLIKVAPDNNIKYYDEVRNSVLVRESENGRLMCAGGGDGHLIYQYDKQNDKFNPIQLDFNFDKPNSIAVYDFQFDSLDNLWVASDIGLLYTNVQKRGNGVVDRIALSGFDVNEPIRAIAVAEDMLWLANTHGLVAYTNEKVVLFSRQNGLPSKILRERGLMIDHNKDLLIATAKGIAKIDAGYSTFRDTPSPVFKSLLINDEKINLEEGVSYSFPFNSKLDAEFMSLSYPSNNIEYQTRIIGLDDTWSKASANRNISILGFSEGSYTVEVRARNGGYVWSDPLQFSFIITKPWFKKWWAIALFIIGVGGLVLLVVKIYNQNLIAQKKKLQKEVEERSQEINRQKNEIIEQQKKIIQQKEELIEKNKAVYDSQKALSEADVNYLKLKEKQLQNQIEFKNKQLTTHTLNIIQKNETLKDLRDKLDHIVKSGGKTTNELRQTLKIIDESFKLDKDWEEFRMYFEQIYTGFYTKLKLNYPELTNQELRLCALTRLNLSNAECASILGISPDSIKVSRTRLRKKLNLQNNQSLTDFILSI